jgi:large subunit ribosomal protein L24
MAAKIKKGDQVIVTKGRDKGKKGEVLRVIPTDNRAVVQGVNIVKKHKRPSQMDPGGIKPEEAPLALANLAIVDPKTGEATRVGFKILADGRKVRFAKKSGDVIDV